MCFLQCQVEKGVVKVPQQNIPEGLTLVGQEMIPKWQRRSIPGNPQQKNSSDSHTILEKSLSAPGPTNHLKIKKNKRVHAD